MPDDGIHWTPYPLLSRNALFSLSVGMRSVGKTTGAIRWACKDWINNDGEGACDFVWLRRYKSELKTVKSFFDNINGLKFFKKHEFRTNGRNAEVSWSYTAGKPVWVKFGTFAALTEGIANKGTPYPRVNKLIFDEFIIPPKKKLYYIDDEFSYFLEFFSTVDRYEDRVRALLLANAADVINPYCLSWGISNFEQEFTKYSKGNVCVEMVQNEKFVEAVKQTRFGSMIDGTAYGAYAIENKFINSDDSFIAAKSQRAEFHYSFIYEGTEFGAWWDFWGGCVYINQKIPRNEGFKFVLQRKDMRPNTLMLEKASGYLKKIKQMYMQGACFFSDTQTRELFFKMLALCGIR